MGFAETHGVFVKSLPEHGLWLNGQDSNWNLIVKQTTQDIFQNMTLQPNTNSFGLPERLSFSFVAQHSKAPWFKASYRNNGIIFTYRDGAKQEMFLPCDMLALTSCMDLPSDKNEVLKNIQKYYSNQIMKHWNRFASEDIDTTLMRMHHLNIISGQQYTDTELVREYVNLFRESQWYMPLTADHDRLMSYNECITYKPLPIQILWAFGNSEKIMQEAKKHNIPLYDWIDDFLHSRTQ